MSFRLPRKTKVCGSTHVFCQARFRDDVLLVVRAWIELRLCYPVGFVRRKDAVVLILLPVASILLVHAHHNVRVIVRIVLQQWKHGDQINL